MSFPDFPYITRSDRSFTLVKEQTIRNRYGYDSDCPVEYPLESATLTEAIAEAAERLGIAPERINVDGEVLDMPDVSERGSR